MGSKEVYFYKGETAGNFKQNLFFREDLWGLIPRFPKADGQSHSYKKKTDTVGCMVIDQNDRSTAQIHAEGKVTITERDGKPVNIKLESAQTVTAKQVADTKDTYEMSVPPPSFLNAMTRQWNRTKKSGLYPEKTRLQITDGGNKISVKKIFGGSVSSGEFLNETGVLTQVDRKDVPTKVQKACDKLAK